MSQARFLEVSILLCAAACTATKSGTTGGGSEGGGGGGEGSGSGMSNLVFAVVGDTRPAIPEDTANYPTPIITKIFQDIAAENPAPEFVVATGDYMFTFINQAQPQLDLYMGARAEFSGMLYPAMGNHECNSLTNSNCAGAPTANMTAFMSSMLAPIGQTQPYYTETFNAADNSWTAKFVFIACNAWDSTQASWLDGELAKSTTYTFVVRHEGTDAVSGAPCPDSDTTINKYPLTLRISGHSHLYKHNAAAKEIIVGIGGAPLTSGTNYGYAMIERNGDGTLTITVYDYMTHATLDSFTIPAG